MPNSRRRRFSVRNGIAGREPCKQQNNLSAIPQEPDGDSKLIAQNSSKTKNKRNANFTNDIRNISRIAESASVSPTPMMKRHSNIVINADKDITASSSKIDIYHFMHYCEMSEQSVETTDAMDCNCAMDNILKKPVLQEDREMNPIMRDKHPRQHRIKVRSPKRRSVIMDQSNKNNETKIVDLKGNCAKNKKVAECTTKDNRSCSTNDNIIIRTKLTVSSATDPIDWKQQIEEVIEEVMEEMPATVSKESEVERQSDHSLDDMCRICHGGDSLCPELGQLISACACRGTVGRVHVKCLERWLTESGKSRCELCGTRYVTRRVHRYGVPRALLMWILSQNAKQLMVDSLGIMLMSPLAVLAAWLSGRTLAGLMTQDSHTTPWPLASTFVLACMTLVCYYCWIVSAATRHALGWWIWYRSQYEVRLQLQNDE